MINIKTIEEYKSYCSRALILAFKIDITEEEQQELEQITRALEAWDSSTQKD